MLKILRKTRPAVVGFVILFAFSFYGLLLADSSNVKAKQAAVQAKSAAAKAEASAQAGHDLAIQVNKKACDTTNAGRLGTRDVAKRFAAAEVAQVVDLQRRFEQADALNPPTTPQGVASERAGELFFTGLVEDTKTSTTTAVNELINHNPLLDCSKLPATATR